MIGLDTLAVLAGRADSDGRRFWRKLAAVFARLPFAENKHSCLSGGASLTGVLFKKANKG